MADEGHHRAARTLAAFRHGAEFPCAMLSRMVRVFKNDLSSSGEAFEGPLDASDPGEPATQLLFVVTTLHGTVERALHTGPFQLAGLIE